MRIEASAPAGDLPLLARDAATPHHHSRADFQYTPLPPRATQLASAVRDVDRPAVDALHLTPSVGTQYSTTLRLDQTLRLRVRRDATHHSPNARNPGFLSGAGVSYLVGFTLLNRPPGLRICRGIRCSMSCSDYRVGTGTTGTYDMSTASRCSGHSGGCIDTPDDHAVGLGCCDGGHRGHEVLQLRLGVFALHLKHRSPLHLRQPHLCRFAKFKFRELTSRFPSRTRPPTHPG